MVFEEASSDPEAEEKSGKRHPAMYWSVFLKNKGVGQQASSSLTKKIRPVVQLGDIYRLVSPYDHLGVASLMYTSPEKDKAVFYWWKIEHFVNQHLPRVTMAATKPYS